MWQVSSGILLLPGIKRLLADPHVVDHLGHQCAGLRLVQRISNLLLGKALPSSRQSSPSKGQNIAGKLTLTLEEKTGRTSKKGIDLLTDDLDDVVLLFPLKAGIHW